MGIVSGNARTRIEKAGLDSRVIRAFIPYMVDNDLRNDLSLLCNHRDDSTMDNFGRAQWMYVSKNEWTILKNRLMNIHIYVDKLDVLSSLKEQDVRPYDVQKVYVGKASLTKRIGATNKYESKYYLTKLEQYFASTVNYASHIQDRPCEVKYRVVGAG